MTMILRVSVRCILVKNGRILVQLSKHGDFYRLPGGRVRPDETLIQALRRELLEELGVSSTEPEYLLYIVDSFYKRKNSVVHDIGFYFLCKNRVEEEMKPREEHVKIEWIPIEKLNKDNFRPIALAEILKKDLASANLPSTQYIVNIET